MPELYTFTTEAIYSKEELDKTISFLREENIDHTIHTIKDGLCFISGYSWEEDCGFPVHLQMLFERSGINCVFCDNHCYGIISGGNYDLFFNESSTNVKHYEPKK